MRSLPCLTLAFVLCLQTAPGTAQKPATATAPSWPQTYPTGADTPLGARIAALLTDADVAHAHWGIAVTGTDGTPIYGLDEDKLFRPASTAKLFTTAAAIAILGPENTVETNLYGALNTQTGVLNGDLELIGGGDSSFNTNDLPYRASPATATAPRDLANLADQLVARGLRHITGNVVGNDALFGHEVPPEGWAAEDLLWGYGALPSALSIADNELHTTITPAPVSFPPPIGSDIAARIAIDQTVPYLKIDSSMLTRPPDATPKLSLSIFAASEPTHTLRIDGGIVSGNSPVHVTFAIDDPALYAAESLKKLLIDRGVQIDGDALPRHADTVTQESYLKAWRNPAGVSNGIDLSCGAAPDRPQLLVTHTSPPLIEDITFALKTSANLHVENILRLLALKDSCPGAPAVYGARLVRTWLLHAGLQEGDFLFYDGSGLSTKDLVTPRAEAQLLAYAARQPWFGDWKSALPIGGVDGTLDTRFKDAPLKGHVFAKTGTLGESRALAGYLDCASGRQVIFSILVDNHEPGTSADLTTMDKIVQAIAATN